MVEDKDKPYSSSDASFTYHHYTEAIDYSLSSITSGYLNLSFYFQDVDYLLRRAVLSEFNLIHFSQVGEEAHYEFVHDVDISKRRSKESLCRRLLFIR